MKKLINKYKSLNLQVKCSIWFLVCAFLQKGISVITTPIFTRLLNTTEYGQYNVFNSWLGIVTIFVSLNLYCGVYTRGLVKFEEERSVFISSIQGLNLALTLFWTVIYILFRDFWNQLFGLTTVQMLAMLVMIWATSVFSFWSVEQRVDYKYKALVIVTIIVSILKPLIGVILVLNAEDKVTARILGLALVEIVAYTGLFVIQVKRGKKLFSAKFWKHALLFNLPLIPHYLSQTVLTSSDRIMIGRMIGESEAGIYSLAYSVSLMMTIFNTALSATIEPWIYKKIKEGRIEDISKAAYPAFLIIAGVNLFLIAFAPEVIRLFAPIEYHDAIWVIPPVCLSSLFTFAYMFFAAFEFYYEKTSFIAISTIISAALNIGLNYIFIPIFNYYAAAYTTLVCYMLYAGFHYLSMSRICKKEFANRKPFSAKLLVVFFLASFVIGFSTMFTYNYPIIRYILLGVAIIITLVNYKRIIKHLKMIIGLKKHNS